MKLGLGTGLQADVEPTAMRHQLLHHGLHLVDLDGVDDEVLALVVILFGRLLEAAGQLLDAVVQDVGETQQSGSRDVARTQLVHHVHQVDRHATLLGSDGNVTQFVDAEVFLTPALDVVEFGAVLNAPFVHACQLLLYLSGSTISIDKNTLFFAILRIFCLTILFFPYFCTIVRPRR